MTHLVGVDISMPVPGLLHEPTNNKLQLACYLELSLSHIPNKFQPHQNTQGFMIPFFRWRQPRHSHLPKLMQFVGGSANEAQRAPTLGFCPSPFWKAQLRVCSMLCIRNSSHTACSLLSPGQTLLIYHSTSPKPDCALRILLNTVLQEHTTN